MADNIPDISPVVRRNAEWADRFSGASTNVAQRQRYAQDQAAMAQELLNARQTEQYRQAQTNKTAQDFYFRQQDMNRKEAMDKATLEIRHQQQDNKDSLVPAQIKLTEAKAAAATAMEKQKIDSETRHAQNAVRVANDTNAFEQAQSDLQASGVMPGSKEYAVSTIQQALKYPFIPIDLRKNILAQAKIKIDPDQLMADGAKFAKDYTLQPAETADGGWTGKWIPNKASPVAKAGPDPLQQKLSKLEALRMKPNLDKDQTSYLDDEIKNVRGQMQQASPAAPLTDTTAPVPADQTQVTAPDTTDELGINEESQPAPVATATPTSPPSTVDRFLATVPTVPLPTMDMAQGVRVPPVTPTAVTPAPATPAAPDIHAAADAAIKAGANPDTVKARLVKLGGNPAQLTYDD